MDYILHTRFFQCPVSDSWCHQTPVIKGLGLALTLGRRSRGILLPASRTCLYVFLTLAHVRVITCNMSAQGGPLCSPVALRLPYRIPAVCVTRQTRCALLATETKSSPQHCPPLHREGQYSVVGSGARTWRPSSCVVTVYRTARSRVLRSTFYWCGSPRTGQASTTSTSSLSLVFTLTGPGLRSRRDGICALEGWSRPLWSERVP